MGLPSDLIDLASRARYELETYIDTWLPLHQHTGVQVRQETTVHRYLNHTSASESRARRGKTSEIYFC